MNYVVRESHLEMVGLDQQQVNMKKNKMTTYSGITFDPLNVKLEQINIKDIAHALSNICRYNGHSKFFYSVGQHSILLTQYILQSKLEDKLNKARFALTHDASEAFLCDIPDPIKQLPEFEFYRNTELKLQSLIYSKFNLNSDFPDDVKNLDIVIRCDEMNTLFNLENKYKNVLGIEIKPMQPKEVENNFLIYYNNLFNI